MTDKHVLPLKEVSVLIDGATLIHKGEVTLAKGEQRITLTKLSEFLDPFSFRVKGKGKFSLIDVSPRLEYIPIEDKELTELDEKIKTLERKIKEKKLEKEVIEVSMETLDETIKSVGSGFGDWGLRKGLTTNDFNAYFEYYQKGARGERTKVLKIEKQIEDLTEEIEILRLKKEQVSYSDERFYEVDISVNAEVAGEVELEIIYTISHSHWEPFYIFELKKDKAAIQRLARITNQSGFDWENVKITVTTGSRLPLSIDKVDPFYLRLQPIDVFRKKASRPATPMAYRAKMAPKKRDEETLDMLVEAAPPPAPEAEMEYLESPCFSFQQFSKRL